MGAATLQTWLMLLNKLRRKFSSQIGGACNFNDLATQKVHFRYCNVVIILDNDQRVLKTKYKINHSFNW